MTANAKRSVSVGLTDFGGSTAPCGQQHLTLGGAGTFPESHGRLGVVRWQHVSCTGADLAQSCRCKTQHDPGGRAKTKLVAKAANWWRNTVITIHYTRHGSTMFGRERNLANQSPSQ